VFIIFKAFSLPALIDAAQQWRQQSLATGSAVVVVALREKTNQLGRLGGAPNKS
jgi:hypothetical protein